jgi:hypothetical protein
MSVEIICVAADCPYAWPVDDLKKDDCVKRARKEGIQAAMIASWHSRNAQIAIGAMLSGQVSIRLIAGFQPTGKVLQARVSDGHCQDGPNNVAYRRSVSVSNAIRSRHHSQQSQPKEANEQQPCPELHA